MTAGDVDLSLSQFVNAWKVMCEPSAAYRGESRDGLECVFSGLPIAFFNAAFATDRDLTAESLAASGREARAWAAESGLPWLYVATRETLQPGVDPVR